MRIAIFASVWAQNLGDELILKNEIQAIEEGKIFPLPLAKTFKKTEKEPLFNFRVFTYDAKSPFLKKENISYIEYFPYGIKSPKNIFKNIRNFICFIVTTLWADFIIIWGGGLFYDSELQASENNLKLWKWRTSIFRFFGKKVIFYWMSIDIKNPLNRGLIQNIFEKNFKVFVRDEASKNLLQELWIQSKEMWDIVFYDHGDNFSKKSFALQTIDSKDFSEQSIEGEKVKDKIVWVALRQGYFGENKDEQILVKNVFDTILKLGAKKIVLLPMSFHPSDYQANDYYFLKNFVSENIVLWGENIGEVYKNFTEKKIDICIAMRLHSIILSQVYEIPFIALSYSKKTDETLKKLSL